MKPMLSKPSQGWTAFQLEERTYFLSHLTNIPMEWLDRAIFGLGSGQEFTVRAMLEPGELRCIVSPAGSRIVTPDGEEWSHVGTMEFCRRLCGDLAAYPEDWAAFGKTSPRDLHHKLKRLKILIE